MVVKSATNKTATSHNEFLCPVFVFSTAISSSSSAFRLISSTDNDFLLHKQKERRRKQDLESFLGFMHKNSKAQRETVFIVLYAVRQHIIHIVLS